MPKLRSHDFDAALYSMLDDPENDPYQMWHSSQIAGGTNYMQYRSAPADALIEQIRATFDDVARGALLARLNQAVVDDQPVALLFDFPSRALVNRRVHGAYVSPSLGFQYQDIWLDPEAP
jgi:peptide/nickel transport system substrate-binding protein